MWKPSVCDEGREENRHPRAAGCSCIEGTSWQRADGYGGIKKNQGAVGFTDDGIPLLDEKLVKEAMERAVKLNVPLSFHEEDPAFIVNNGINHGKVSEQLGIFGSPALAEDCLVARDCMIALHTGAAVDIQHISSAASVKMVKLAKELGAKVYAEVTPHHSP